MTNANALLVRIWDDDDGNGADQEVCTQPSDLHAKYECFASHAW